MGHPQPVAWRTSEHLIADEITGERHLVSIDFPHRFDQLVEPPLILCLDGAWTAGTVRDATRIMSMGGEAPEAVVAGVWFHDHTMSAYLRSRARWYTPTGWVPPPATGVKDVTAADTGHAETYRAFLRERLLPFVRDEANFGEVWLVGHSFSALFGLHVLFNDPTMFDRYILASPSIWWDDRSILAQEAAWAADNQSLPAKVFLSAGENEGGTAFDDDTFRMRANMVELGEQLRDRGYADLDLTWAILAGESHNSTISNAFSKGIRALHAPDVLRVVGDKSAQQIVRSALQGDEG